MRRPARWVIASTVVLAACGVRPSSGSAALRSALKVDRTPDALALTMSRPAYLAVVAFAPSSAPAIARGGPEPGRHLISLDASPLSTAGHGGVSWLSGSEPAANPYSPTTCQLAREIVGRDSRGNPTYATVTKCAYVPIPDPVTYQTSGARPAFFLVIATAAPVSDSLLASAVAGVPVGADGRMAAHHVRHALFRHSAGEWAVVVK